MKNNNEYIKKFNKFSKTENGKNFLIGMAVGILIGFLWELVMWAGLIGGATYLIVKWYRKKETPQRKKATA